MMSVDDRRNFSFTQIATAALYVPVANKSILKTYLFYFFGIKSILSSEERLLDDGINDRQNLRGTYLLTVAHIVYKNF